MLKKMATMITAATAQLCVADQLNLDVIYYQDLILEEPSALEQLKKALLEKGIVGVRGIPEYLEKVRNFIESARSFTALSEETKQAYAPNEDLGEIFLGYESGKEKFKRPDGRWVVDDLKVSYYAFVPDVAQNKWPREVNLKTPFEELSLLMSDLGELVMQKIELIGPKTGIEINQTPRIGRMLYYRSSEQGAADNPYWCGAHFDHGMFTALIPASYFLDGIQVPEPEEAGLYVKTKSDGIFHQVPANNRDILLFQVGEFGQLVTNDRIRATEHRVHKAQGNIERYAMALFFDPPHDTVIRSTSQLTNDARYGGKAGDPCSYAHWHEESFKRYIVKE